MSWQHREAVCFDSQRDVEMMQNLQQRVRPLRSDIQHWPIRRNIAFLALILLVLGASCPSLCFASSADQTRRMTHFNWLKAQGVFESMQVVNGVPQLVLAAGKWKADPYALGIFCSVIFDYYKEKDPTVSQMTVIDGTTGGVYATVDSTGYHKN